MEFKTLIDKKDYLENFTFSKFQHRFKRFFRDSCSAIFSLLCKHNKNQSLLPTSVEKVACGLMASARIGSDNIEYGDSYIGVNKALGVLDGALTIAGENPTRYLPTVWKGSLEEDILTHTYWAVTCLHPMFRKRAEVGFILEKNKVTIGKSGYSEKLQRDLPFYMTIFGSRIFFIDPIRGIVYKSKESRFSDEFGFTKRGSEVYYNGWKIAEETDGGVDVKIDFEVDMTDLKKSEKEELIAQGFDIKYTEWLTTHLGYLGDSNTYIRAHTFILLMVYGFSGGVCFTLMERNSVMTCDHQNAKHNDNRIDNLALVTRTANNKKKDTNLKIFDYGLYFMGLEQKEEKVLSAEEIAQEREKLIEERCEELTAEEAARKYGFIIVE